MRTPPTAVDSISFMQYRREQDIETLKSRSFKSFVALVTLVGVNILYELAVQIAHKNFKSTIIFIPAVAIAAVTAVALVVFLYMQLLVCIHNRTQGYQVLDA